MTIKNESIPIKTSLIIGLIAILVLLHYIVRLLSVQQYFEYRKLQLLIMSSFCIIGGLYLFFRHKVPSKSHKIFASLMILCGIAAAMTFTYYVNMDKLRISNNHFISPGVMTYGNIFGFLFILYPIEVMRPGSINIRRVIFLFLPAAIISSLYFLYINLGGTFYKVNDLNDVITYLAPIDIVLRLLMFGYPIYGLVLVLRYRKEYNTWIEDNFTTSASLSLEWLDYYIIGYFCILTSYLYLITFGAFQTPLAHGIIFILFFGGLYYKVFSHSNPYPENHFKTLKINKEEEEKIIDQRCAELKEVCKFETKIEEYKKVLESWMNTNKPYLRKDFKLMDIAQVLPLNRTYLSRLFNEGYCTTFNNYVTILRIEESIKLMKMDDNFTMAELAEMTGFSSPSVFGRSFLREKGISPKQYKKEFNDEMIVAIDE